MIKASEFKNIRLWPIINNAKAFIFDHPELHPESAAFIKYWKEQKKRCIEGFWGNDSADDTEKWRYMSGPLYFYTNMWTIKMQDKYQKSEYYTRPLLRDNEWIVFNAILAAQGFSGFDDDEQYTCHRLVKKFLDQEQEKRDKNGSLIKLSKLEERELSESNNVLKKDGNYKEYIEAYEFLKRTFDKPLGRPLYENPVKNIIFLSGRGQGKDLEENSILHTREGKVKIKDVNIGDKIYGADGKLTTVISKDYYYDQMQYLITFQDGRVVECGGGHLWNVKRAGRIKSNSINYNTVTTEFLYNNINSRYRKDKINHRNESYFFIPENNCFEKENDNVPIDPYFLGLWLGDGNTKRPSITTIDDEIKDFIYKTSEKYGSKVTLNFNKHKNCPTYHITDGAGSGAKRELHNEFKKLNLYNNKHIPEVYFQSSKEIRIELLRGLMDSDGSCDKIGANFSSSQYVLAKDFYRLCKELGVKTRFGYKNPTFTYKGIKKNGKTSYRIHIKPYFNPFNLKRKADKYSLYNSKVVDKLGIKSIEKTKIKPSICIGVDNEDSLFVVNEYIVTHNSYQMSSIGGHEFTFDGAKYYDPSNKLKLQSGVFVGAADGDKSTDLIAKIKDGLLNIPGFYGEGDDYVPSPFYKQVKGTWNEGEFIEHAYKVQENGEWKIKGSKSKIFHGNFGHDTHDAVGKRCTKIFVEEVGELDKVETVHSANERVLKIGGNKFGMEFCIGTGGNVKYITGVKKLFYNPSQYDYYPFQDYWENSGEVGLFVPATYCFNEVKDENGNTDLEEALEICVDTRNEKSKADTSAPLDFEMMYSPLKISEIFLNPNTNIFPVSLLRNRQAELEIRNLFKAKAQFGTLEWTKEGVVRWMPDMQLKPITSYYVDERANTKGSIVIYEHPGDHVKPKYKSSLFKIAYDIVGSENGGTSFASILVYKGLPDFIQDPSEMRNTIVAEYIGRMNNVDDIHEICVKLAIYYRGRILYEDNTPGFLTYCRQKGFLDLLQPTPNTALGEVYEGVFKKGKFGLKMTGRLIDAADVQTRKWMTEPIEHDQDGNVVRFNVDSIYSPRWLDEYINYDGIGNFDHISCFRILMIWLMDEIAVPLSATEDGKRENAIIDSVLRKREDKIGSFLHY